MGRTAPAAQALERQWHLIDADGQVLGRIATRAARLLQGKHKPTWVPYLDHGDHVIIINAARVRLTGRKEEQKIYRAHSGYEGGLRETRAKIVRERHPIRLVEDAVHGMLPKSILSPGIQQRLSASLRRGDGGRA